jgi:hypothetical protein
MKEERRDATQNDRNFHFEGIAEYSSNLGGSDDQVKMSFSQ